jgi:hypothetical protein
MHNLSRRCHCFQKEGVSVSSIILLGDRALYQLLEVILHYMAMLYSDSKVRHTLYSELSFICLQVCTVLPIGFMSRRQGVMLSRHDFLNLH